MAASLPTPFDYHKFLRTVLQTNPAGLPVSLVTEADFLRGQFARYPYRNYFYGIGVAHEDSRRLRIDTQEFTLGAQTMLIIGPGITRLWLDDHWSLKNTTVFFTPDAFVSLLRTDFLQDLPFFKPGAEHILPLQTDQYHYVTTLLTLMRESLTHPSVTSGLLLALLSYVRNAYAAGVAPALNLTRSQTIVRTFGALVQQHHIAHRDVGFYADQLNLTPKYLGEVSKHETGRSAKAVIDDFVLQEAQSLLKQTAMSVQEIVYWLGYGDASYFAKVFKQKVGVTPLTYRRSG